MFDPLPRKSRRRLKKEWDEKAQVWNRTRSLRVRRPRVNALGYFSLKFYFSFSQKSNTSTSPTFSKGSRGLVSRTLQKLTFELIYSGSSPDIIVSKHPFSAPKAKRLSSYLKRVRPVQVLPSAKLEFRSFDLQWWNRSVRRSKNTQIVD